MSFVVLAHLLGLGGGQAGRATLRGHAPLHSG